MPVERYFIDKALVERKELAIEGEEFHHLSHVMRTKEGEQIELVNGKGVLAKARIAKLDKRKALVCIENVLIIPPEAFEVHLLQALPRPNRLDFIVEKGVELGMSELCLFAADNSERKSLSDSQLKRIHGQMVAAMKQCGRVYLPRLTLLPTLEEWFSQHNIPLCFGDLSADAPTLYSCWSALCQQRTIAFAIGPEKGFSQKELNLLKQKNAIGVSLHPNILRTDTAALVALSLIAHHLMQKNLSSIISRLTT